MSTFERVRFADGIRRRTVILRDATEETVLGVSCVIGTEVDRHGDEIATGGADRRVRIIDLALVTKRTPLRFSLKYATLEAS